MKIATIALQTASRLRLAFEHEHAPTLLRQLSRTNQSAQSAANDNYIILHGGSKFFTFHYSLLPSYR